MFIIEKVVYNLQLSVFNKEELKLLFILQEQNTTSWHLRDNKTEFEMSQKFLKRTPWVFWVRKIFTEWVKEKEVFALNKGLLSFTVDSQGPAQCYL